jgi:hypothetical protein
LKLTRHELIARAMAPAAAAMSEEDNAVRAGRHIQVSMQGDAVSGHQHLLVDRGE